MVQRIFAVLVGILVVAGIIALLVRALTPDDGKDGKKK